MWVRVSRHRRTYRRPLASRDRHPVDDDLVTAAVDPERKRPGSDTRERGHRDDLAIRGRRRVQADRLEEGRTPVDADGAAGRAGRRDDGDPPGDDAVRVSLAPEVEDREKVLLKYAVPVPSDHVPDRVSERSSSGTTVHVSAVAADVPPSDACAMTMKQYVSPALPASVPTVVVVPASPVIQPPNVPFHGATR